MRISLLKISVSLLIIYFSFSLQTNYQPPEDLYTCCDAFGCHKCCWLGGYYECSWDWYTSYYHFFKRDESTFFADLDLYSGLGDVINNYARGDLCITLWKAIYGYTCLLEEGGPYCKNAKGECYSDFLGLGSCRLIKRDDKLYAPKDYHFNKEVQKQITYIFFKGKDYYFWPYAYGLAFDTKQLGSSVRVTVPRVFLLIGEYFSYRCELAKERGWKCPGIYFEVDETSGEPPKYLIEFDDVKRVGSYIVGRVPLELPSNFIYGECSSLKTHCEFETKHPLQLLPLFIKAKVSNNKVIVENEEFVRKMIPIAKGVYKIREEFCNIDGWELKLKEYGIEGFYCVEGYLYLNGKFSDWTDLCPEYVISVEGFRTGKILANGSLESIETEIIYPISKSPEIKKGIINAGRIELKDWNLPSPRGPFYGYKPIFYYVLVRVDVDTWWNLDNTVKYTISNVKGFKKEYTVNKGKRGNIYDKSAILYNIYPAVDEASKILEEALEDLSRQYLTTRYIDYYEVNLPPRPSFIVLKVDFPEGVRFSTRGIFFNYLNQKNEVVSGEYKISKDKIILLVPEDAKEIYLSIPIGVKEKDFVDLNLNEILDFEDGYKFVLIKIKREDDFEAYIHAEPNGTFIGINDERYIPWGFTNETSLFFIEIDKNLYKVDLVLFNKTNINVDVISPIIKHEVTTVGIWSEIVPSLEAQPEPDKVYVFEFFSRNLPESIKKIDKRYIKKVRLNLSWLDRYTLLVLTEGEYFSARLLKYAPVVYSLSHNLLLDLWLQIYSNFFTSVNVLKFDYHNVTYMLPVQFIGAGDGFCNPLRFEKCYLKDVFPECSPEKIEEMTNDICYCPDISENCSILVRDIFGCVVRKYINEPASEECQCEWTWHYPTKWRLNLTSRNYCCPPDAQIAFSHGVKLMDSGDIIKIGGSNCGNLTIEFERVKPKDWVWGPYTFYVERNMTVSCEGFSGAAFACLTEQALSEVKNEVINPNLKDWIKEIEAEINSKNNSDIIYEVNVTYYNSGKGKFEENKPVSEIDNIEVSGLEKLDGRERFFVDAKLLNCKVEEVGNIEVEDAGSTFEGPYQEYLGLVCYYKVHCKYRVKIYLNKISCTGLEFHHDLIEMVPKEKGKVTFDIEIFKERKLSIFDLNVTYRIPCTETEEGWACYFNQPPSGYVR